MIRIDRNTLCILGCGGFIGSHLVDRLLSAGVWSVIGIDTVVDKVAPFLNNPRFEFVKMDATRMDAVRPFIERSDVVLNLVALCNPSLYTTIPVAVIEINYDHPVQVVRLCSELDKWLIHFSTSEVYGMTAAHVAGVDEHTADQVLREDETPLILGSVRAQRWCYAAAKQLLERMLFAYGFQKGLRYTVVRPFNFIGPRMDFIPGVDGDGVPRVIACFMDALMSGKPLKLVDGGTNRRVFTYIDDAIDALVAILEQGQKSPGQVMGQVFNIGNPANETSIAGLAKKMSYIYRSISTANEAGTSATEYVSGKTFYGEGYEDSDRRVPDITKAQSLLGWSPRVGLDEALEKTVRSYKVQYGERMQREKTA